MNKQQRFILFVQTILAARDISEEFSLTFIHDAIDVSEKELDTAWKEFGLIEMDCAREFVDWRYNTTGTFDSAPKWLSKETIGKILVG